MGWEHNKTKFCNRFERNLRKGEAEQSVYNFLANGYLNYYFTEILYEKFLHSCYHSFGFDCCRYYQENGTYHIGRVAIIKEYRGKHLGNKIMQIAEDYIKKDGGQTIEVSTQVRVSEFYKKIGYKKSAIFILMNFVNI